MNEKVSLSGASESTRPLLGFVNNLLKNTRFTQRAQVLFVFLFSFILANLLVASAVAGKNAGTAITWLLWWPLIPLTFVFVGRFWCAVCPFGAVSDWTRRIGLNKPVPKFIKNSGLWIINGLFFLITWYDLAFGLTTSVQATAVLFLLVLGSAVAFSLLFERRAWCHYACPVGGVFGNYAQTSVLEMRNEPEICDGCRDLHCFHGRADISGCALSLTPKTLESNRMCNFCGDCLKSCEKGSPHIVTREKAGNELWLKTKPRFDEAFLAAALVAFISISSLGMLEIWPVITKAVGGGEGRGGFLINSLFMLLIFGVIVGLYTLASFVSARLVKEKTAVNFARFGYALIPLSLATHVAHNMNHFLMEGRLIIPAFLSLFSFTEPTLGTAGHGTAALVSPAYVQGLQFILVASGVLFSYYVTTRIASKNEGVVSGIKAVAWPHFVVISTFGLLSFMLFSLPMTMRH